MGTVNCIRTVVAGALMYFLLAGTAWALTATDCATCHGASVVSSHHDTTDPNSYFNQGQCEQCHVGITTSGDCTTCHTTKGFNNKHHAVPAGQTAIDCAQCHTGAGNPKDCSSCHKGDVPRTFHHTKLTAYRDAATGKLNCTTCHPGAKLTSDCKSCHNESSAVYRSTHHNYVSPTTNSKPVCTSCHTQLKATTGSCQDCHAPRAKMDKHHALTGAPAYMSCGFCHAGLASGPKETRGGCNVCHATANLPLHHDKVRTERSMTCNQCHKNAVAVAGCESCHINGTTPDTTAIHHDQTPGAPYASGNCGACHTSAGFARANCNSSACHPALSPTSGARHHRADVITKYPVFQSSSNPGSADCSICHMTNYGFVNGVFQMTIVPPPADDCIFCHERIIQRGDVQATHHNTTATTSGNCGLCHSGVNTSGGACATCHSATSSKPATSQTHHTAATTNNTPCANCHKGISPSAACADCHTTASGNDASRHHLFKNSQSQLYACNTCHTGASNIYQACKGCHEKVSINGAVTIVASSTWHHMTTIYSTGSCTTCHSTVDGSSLQKDCSYCHVGTGKPSIVTRHHSTDSYLTGSCSGCHVNTAPANIPCAGCHTTSLTKHHSKTVTVGTTITPKPCRDCHSTIQLIGGSCQGCHTAPIPQIHHGDPLTAVNGNCAVCHQSVSSPDSCSTCHTTTTHHTTTWSQTGDCTHCHLVPASAVDRPTQAACRECHGAAMHAKGGPIKNFGACAACHNTTPFHGEPGIIPDGSESRAPTNTGAGRGKFNIFMARNSAQGEEGKWQPNTRLTFSTKSISHAGKSYTVPYFTGASVAIVNLALGKTASASGAESGYSASLVVDGNASSTRWWKKSTSTQTLTVDLGASKNINKVTVRWHTYFAKSYQVQTATSSYGPWTTVASTTAGDGGVDERSFTARSARYVRINCQKTPVVNNVLSPNGYSIYELEVYAP